MHEILSLQRMLSVEVIYFSRDCEKAFLQFGSDQFFHSLLQLRRSDSVLNKQRTGK